MMETARLALARANVSLMGDEEEQFCDGNCVWTDHHPNCVLARDPLAEKWPVRVHAAGHGQWAFVAAPRSGTGYPTKQAAKDAGEAARAAALAAFGVQS